MAAALDTATKMPHPTTPYYPLGVEITGWLANEWSVPALLGIFFGVCAVLCTTSYMLAKRIRPSITQGEVWSFVWLVLSGSLHIFFEGYYALNQASMGPLQTIMGQLWKEFAFCDSRYLTQDAFVLCMESMTAAFWGPGCFIVAWMTVYEHPWRYPLQGLVTAGQVYGVLLYYATSMFDHFVKGVTYSRPEAYYFWGYYFLMNFFWIIFPGILLWSSMSHSAKAIETVSRMNKGRKKQQQS